ncbi:MAG: hypothetical protein U0822_22120 [Anaerolineae bacterium]
MSPTIPPKPNAISSVDLKQRLAAVYHLLIQQGLKAHRAESADNHITRVEVDDRTEDAKQ